MWLNTYYSSQIQQNRIRNTTELTKLFHEFSIRLNKDSLTFVCCWYVNNLCFRCCQYINIISFSVYANVSNCTCDRTTLYMQIHNEIILLIQRLTTTVCFCTTLVSTPSLLPVVVDVNSNTVMFFNGPGLWNEGFLFDCGECGNP